MARHYVTFGQGHRHNIQGHVLDKDTVAVFDAPDYNTGREQAFKFFGPVFCTDYHDKEWDGQHNAAHFPKGYVVLDVYTQEEKFKQMGDACIKHMMAINPRGNIKTFIRMAVEYGYKQALKSTSKE